ncbi:hypothetical protein LXA43DRAFT_1105450 [Ganoderma leucocontextum]|nr:hypothetical protein LXA43DRAFT_1105450 [Ganoderma leucocontextum]
MKSRPVLRSIGWNSLAGMLVLLLFPAVTEAAGGLSLDPNPPSVCDTLTIRWPPTTAQFFSVKIVDQNRRNPCTVKPNNFLYPTTFLNASVLGGDPISNSDIGGADPDGSDITDVFDTAYNRWDFLWVAHLRLSISGSIRNLWGYFEFRTPRIYQNVEFNARQPLGHFSSRYISLSLCVPKS